jgi:hypothetical protein
MNYAFTQDTQNKWFCLLTDTCCPIISPKRFRYLFYENYNKSIFSWKPAWWNPRYHKRGNLSKLPKELWLANEAWFILTREHVNMVFAFVTKEPVITQTICNGGLANETLFAVIFKLYEKRASNIICELSHLIDWDRRSSTTSPHVFKEANEQDIHFINTNLERNKYAVFIRKISPEFPDEIIHHYIYELNKKKDNELTIYDELTIHDVFNKYFIILVFIYIFYIVIF